MTLPKDLSDAEVQQLVKMGKQRGYVTYEEMNKFLPTHLVSSDRLDDVMIMFSDMDIEIVNKQRKQADEPSAAAELRTSKPDNDPQQRPGAGLPAQDGLGLPPLPRRRDRDRKAHRGRRVHRQAHRA